LSATATTNWMTHPTANGSNSAQTPSPLKMVARLYATTMISAVAAPGGCSEPVTLMATMAVATASAPASQVNAAPSITRRQNRPHRPLSSVPPKQLRGCARGEWGAPWTSAALAPKEANICTGADDGRAACWQMAMMAAIEINAPRNAARSSSVGGRDGKRSEDAVDNLLPVRGSVTVLGFVESGSAAELKLGVSGVAGCAPGTRASMAHLKSVTY